MKQSNFVVFDVETGGFDPAKNPVMEIALLAIDGTTLKEIKRWETLIKPYDDLEIAQRAVETHGIKPAVAERDGMLLKDAVKYLAEWLDSVNPNKRGFNQASMVAHNAEFDMKFLEDMFNRCNKNLWSHCRRVPICTMALSRMYLEKPNSLKLGNVVETMGLNLANAHRAMNDVVVTAEYFVNLSNRMRNNEVVSSKAVKKEKKQRETFQM